MLNLIELHEKFKQILGDIGEENKFDFKNKVKFGKYNLVSSFASGIYKTLLLNESTISNFSKALYSYRVSSEDISFEENFEVS